MAPETLPYATPSSPQPPNESFGARTASGFFWLTAQTIGAKFINLGGNILLAWYLIKANFGLVSMALTVADFATLIQQGGLRDILVYRHRQYRRWANSAFWMSCALGLAAGLFMAAAAIPAAMFYGQPEVTRLILLLAIAAPFSSLDVVADARLQTQMRFSYLAKVKLGIAALTLALSLAMARAGWGPYALVLPRPIVSVVRLIALWIVARPPIRFDFHFRRWRYLFSDNLTLLMAGVVDMFTWNGDFIVLGRTHVEAVLGLYYWAFNLSIQTMQLFTSNLTGVLFPVLSQISDRVDQTRSFLKATRLLAILAVPLCLLQAAMADPGVHLLFKPQWWSGIRVLQILSLGMAARVVASPGGSLIQAQGRFRVTLFTNIIFASAFVSMALIGSRYDLTWHHFLHRLQVDDLNAALSVAIAVATYYTLIGPIFLYIAIHPGRGSLLDIIELYGVPLCAGGIAVGIAAAISHYIPPVRGQNLVRLIELPIVSILIYLPLIRMAAPREWAELHTRIGALIRKRFPARASV